MKLFLKKKKIVISAAYGMGNLGDEVICETMIKDILSINPNAKISILVFNKDLFFKAHPSWKGNKSISVESMNYQKKIFFQPLEFLSIVKGFFKIVFCGIFIWGGGGLIRNRPDWLQIYISPLRVAQFFRKKTIIWSIGVDTVTNQRVVALVNKIKKIDFFSVRDETSQRNLSDILKTIEENKIQVVRDSVFHFSEEKVIANPHKNIYNIGLNLSFWKADFSKKIQIDQFLNSLAQVFNEISEKINYKIIYLPTAPLKDNLLFEKLKSKFKPQILVESPNINTSYDYLDELLKLNLFIGMRMHSFILASQVNKLPILGIIYDEKVEAIKKELNLKNKIWPIEELLAKPELLKREILNCLKEPQSFLIDFRKFRKDSTKIYSILKLYL